MSYKVLFRKYFDKDKRFEFEIFQWHWCYVLPTLVINIFNDSHRIFTIKWLFWSLIFTWRLYQQTAINFDCIDTVNLNKE